VSSAWVSEWQGLLVTLKVVRTRCKLNAVGRVIRNRNNLREHMENSARSIQTSQIYFALQNSRLNSFVWIFWKYFNLCGLRILASYSVQKWSNRTLGGHELLPLRLNQPTAAFPKSAEECRPGGVCEMIPTFQHSCKCSRANNLHWARLKQRHTLVNVQERRCHVVVVLFEV